MDEGALGTPRVVHSRWNRLSLEDDPDRADDVHRAPAKGWVELHFHAAPSRRPIDGSSRDMPSQHLFEAECLRAQLDGRVLPVRPSGLVLDGVRPFRAQLDDVRLADEPVVLRPKRDAPEHVDPAVSTLDVRLHPLVGELTLDRVEVLVVGLLDVNQRALAWTVAVVLKGRDRHLEDRRRVREHVRSAETSEDDARG